jgi:hypothetical protein
LCWSRSGNCFIRAEASSLYLGIKFLPGDPVVDTCVPFPGAAVGDATAGVVGDAPAHVGAAVLTVTPALQKKLASASDSKR